MSLRPGRQLEAVLAAAVLGGGLLLVLTQAGDASRWRSAPPASAASPPAVAPPQHFVATSGGALRIPVPGVAPNALVDSFNDSREGGARGHRAIDIPAPRGTPVVAAGDGTVEKLFQSVRGGTTLYLRSPDGQRITYYAHLDHYAPGIHEGQQVHSGEVIGAVGSSGDADPGAPHLHFAVMVMAPGEPWWAGNPVDPFPLLGGKAR